MTAAPVTVPPETSLVDARQLLLDRNIRHLLVVNADRLVGIVTDRDIRLNLPSRATSLSAWEVNHALLRLTVREVMSQPVITVGPAMDAEEAARLMLRHTISALPVVDDGRLLGILTNTDVIRAFIGGAHDGLT